MKPFVQESTALYGYMIENSEYSSHWHVKLPTGETLIACSSKWDAHCHVCELEAREYNGLKPDLIRILKDYVRKLEVDDSDQGAVGKMKDASAILKILQKEV